MKTNQFTADQSITSLTLAAAGQKVGDVCRPLGMREGTFYRWKPHYGSMDASHLRRLHPLRSQIVGCSRGWRIARAILARSRMD